jgi:hypothetical protein
MTCRIKIKTYLVGVLSLACVFLSGHIARADVAVKIVIANPSDDKTQAIPVSYELPPGLEKGDILDAGGMQVDYNVSRSSFFVTGDVELKPKETRTLKVVIRDIWNIPEEDIVKMSEMLNNKSETLKTPENSEIVDLVSDGLREKLDAILQYQQDNAGNIQKRMEMFTTNRERFKLIKSDIFSLENLVREEKAEDVPKDVLTLVIEARNIANKELTIPVKFYLPREIIPQHIEDAGGLEMRHDPTRDVFYLFAEEVFGPEETKRFYVKVKDVWTIPEDELNGYVAEAIELNEGFKNTVDEEVADSLLESIRTNTRAIIDSQSGAESVKDHVAAFRANEKRLRSIKDDLEKLRTLKPPGVSSDAGKGKIKNILRQMEVFSKVKALSDKLFKEKMTTAKVWGIVLLVVVFAILLTIIFYVIWIINLKKEEGRKYDKVK